MKKVMLVMAVVMFMASAPAFAALTVVNDWDFSPAGNNIDSVNGQALTLSGGATISGDKLNLVGGSALATGPTSITATSNFVIEVLITRTNDWNAARSIVALSGGSGPRLDVGDNYQFSSWGTWDPWAFNGPYTPFAAGQHAVALVVRDTKLVEIYKDSVEGTTYNDGVLSLPSWGATPPTLTLRSNGDWSTFIGTIDRVRISTISGTFNPADLLGPTDGESGPPPAPEIDVTGSGAFGTTLVGTPVIHTFTVDNTAGTAALNISSVTLPGGYSFDLSDPLLSSIGAGLSDTFNVQLDALLAGTYNGNMHIFSNDSDEADFVVALTGQVNPLGGAVAEPSALSLIALGLLGIARRRK